MLKAEIKTNFKKQNKEKQCQRFKASRELIINLLPI